MTDSKDLQHSIDELAKVERRMLRTQQWWYLLFHGVLVGIGGTVGVAAVFTLMLWVLNKLSAIPGADTARYLLEQSVQR